MAGSGYLPHARKHPGSKRRSLILHTKISQDIAMMREKFSVNADLPVLKDCLEDAVKKLTAHYKNPVEFYLNHDTKYQINLSIFQIVNCSFLILQQC